MPAIKADAIVHETNMVAEQEVNVVIGMDKIVRVNVDGVCALRIRCTRGTKMYIDSFTEEEIIFTY